MIWRYAKVENYNEKLYDVFLNYSYNDLMDLFRKAKTKEEQDFYVMLSNLVLKREAQKVIGK
nr:hypothetical protein [Clostridium butyricum]